MKTQLKQNESLELEVRQHIIVLIIPIIISIIMAIIGIALYKTSSLATYIIILLAIGYLTYKIMERRNNIWVVTNQRIIDEFGVLSLNSKETPLDKINNISFRKSFTGRIFNYGDIQIQSAAEAGMTTYRKIEKPGLLKDTISRMHEEYKGNFVQKRDNYSASDEIEKLYRLMEKGIITKEEFEERKGKILSN